MNCLRCRIDIPRGLYCENCRKTLGIREFKRNPNPNRQIDRERFAKDLALARRIRGESNSNPSRGLPDNPQSSSQTRDINPFIKSSAYFAEHLSEFLDLSSSAALSNTSKSNFRHLNPLQNLSTRNMIHSPQFQPGSFYKEARGYNLILRLLEEHGYRFLNRAGQQQSYQTLLDSHPTVREPAFSDHNSIRDRGGNFIGQRTYMENIGYDHKQMGAVTFPDFYCLSSTGEHIYFELKTPSSREKAKTRGYVHQYFFTNYTQINTEITNRSHRMGRVWPRGKHILLIDLNSSCSTLEAGILEMLTFFKEKQDAQNWFKILLSGIQFAFCDSTNQYLTLSPVYSLEKMMDIEKQTKTSFFSRVPYAGPQYNSFKLKINDWLDGQHNQISDQWYRDHHLEIGQIIIVNDIQYRIAISKGNSIKAVPRMPTTFRYQNQSFRFIDVPADGNCLFAAIAALTTTADRQETATSIRHQISQRLHAHLDLVPEGMYLQLGDGTQVIEVRGKENYLSKMAENNIWGGLPEIRAYSYIRPILVFEDANTPRLFVNGAMQAINWSSLPAHVIFIGFLGNHYVALRR